MRLFTKEQRDTKDVWHKEKTAGIVFLSKLIVNQVVHGVQSHHKCTGGGHPIRVSHTAQGRCNREHQL